MTDRETVVRLRKEAGIEFDRIEIDGVHIDVAIVVLMDELSRFYTLAQNEALERAACELGRDSDGFDAKIRALKVPQ